ncbi:MAG: gliding motility-associated ABC transporter permease subunit GldF [Microbacter sp.]
MMALLKKEIANFFSSAIGYLVVGVFLTLTGLLLWVFPGNYNIIDSGYAQVDGLFSLAPFLYLFLIPAITMRLFAEEKRSGTLELLFTRPISKWQIVLAKYLAGLILVLVSLLPTIVYFISVSLMAEPIGNVDTGGFWGSFIGLFLLASVYVGIGVYASSLTDNQITAFILAASISFVLYFGFDLVASLILSGEKQLLVQSLGLNAHYKAMSHGVIDSRDVLYFCSVITVFLLGTRWNIRAR